MSLQLHGAPMDLKTCLYRGSFHGLDRHEHSWSKGMNRSKENSGESSRKSNSPGAFASPSSAPCSVEWEDPPRATTLKAERDQGLCSRPPARLSLLLQQVWPAGTRPNRGTGERRFKRLPPSQTAPWRWTSPGEKRSADRSPVQQPRPDRGPSPLTVQV